jgi:methylthioribose-1-phosphate isomerase
MKIEGSHYQSIWLDEAHEQVFILDQTLLPYEVSTIELKTLEDFCVAIQSMQVRGAPLIGVTAALGFAIALRNNSHSEEAIARALLATRPTAVNLHWAVNEIQQVLATAENNKPETAMKRALEIWQQDIDTCEAIGENGLAILKEKSLQKNSTIHVLTHCNAGWLATVDWGTALSPIFKAHEAGIDLHVWVDETRPRNQGYLTAWELHNMDIPHTLIADNTRTTATGDVCNKIGTYLKALAAHDNNIPFYVALPTSTIDWSLNDGIREIPIEQRDGSEVSSIRGLLNEKQVEITAVPHTTPVANYAFDVTPARYVAGLITEKGVVETTPEGMEKLKKKCQ